ncbi:MAG TPA: alpha/beta hydrolase [Polyangiaceae bacterium]
MARPRILMQAPAGTLEWMLTAFAIAALLGVVLLLVSVVYPAQWDGSGRLGTLALLFPLHLLAATALGLSCSAGAWWLGARLAAVLLAVAAISTAVLALVPALSLARLARKLEVEVSIGEYVEHARRWNAGGPERERSVMYGVAADGTKLELDVWRTGKANAGPLRPAVVFLHGGGWTQGSRSNLPDWNRFLNGLGFEVFDVEYRMPPPLRYLDEVGDVKSALGWVAIHAAEYHVDPARISVMGASAGANLALLAAYSMGDPRLPPSTDVPNVAVRSVVNLYGPTDLELLYRRSSSSFYAQTALEAYTGGPPEDLPERYRLLSPLSHVDGEVPATLTLTGQWDRLVPPAHATLLDQALLRVGAAHELVVLPFTDHAFDLNWGGFATQIARAKVAAFLRGAPLGSSG